MKPRPIVIGLALSALGFGVLMPPEAYPSGKMAVILCATFAFLAALIEKRVPGRYLQTGIVIFSLLLAHSLFISVDLYRSIEFVTVLWAYYCVLAFFLFSGPELLRPVAVTMVALAAFVAGYGLYQYFWGFEQTYQFIAYSGSTEVVKAPAMERIASHRVFSTLALPGTLWGFLLMALPFHTVLWKRNRGFDIFNLVLVAGAGLSLAAGFLTRSFGFLTGLVVLVGCWLILKYRRIQWKRLGPVLLVLGVLAGLAIAGGAFYSVRRGAIEAQNPLILRFGNWVSAWHVFAEHPLGTGLNTYGVVYTGVMLPGANETQYAHNTFLQLMSELGYPFLIAVVALLVFLARRPAPWHVERPEASREAHSSGAFGVDSIVPVLLALAVWITHNAIDIDIYFPSVGIIGAALIGVLYAGNHHAAVSSNRAATAAVSVFAVGFLVFSGLVMISSELQHRAQIEYDTAKPLPAAATLEQARAIMPINSSLYHDSGDILLYLYHKMHDTTYLVRATNSFRTAIELSPKKAGHHIGLGLCISSAGNVAGAIDEIRTAQSLYPSGPYIQAVRRLLEKQQPASP